MYFRQAHVLPKMVEMHRAAGANGI